MTPNEAAAYLAGVVSTEDDQASAPTNLHVITGEVSGTSEDGKTLVSIDGLMFSEEDEQYVEIDTLGGLEDGDIATVVLSGEDGHSMSPLAIGSVGSVDRICVRVSEIEADYIKTQQLEAAEARIGDLEADHVSVDDFEAAEARIGTLETTSATIENLNATNARVQTLETDNTNVKGRLTAAEGNITTLTSTKADISLLESDYITSAVIEANYMKTDISNSDVAWIENGTIKDGSITNAMINSVSANKLTAGTIDASNITVTNLNADNITTGTINGQRIGTGSLSLDKLSENVYTETEVDNIVDNLQTQIDGAIETWTGTDIPTLQNTPAVNWQTDSVKDTHVGDVYFVVNSQSQQNGYNYRFTKSGNTYSWQLIKDSDVTAALQRLTTAEGKITTFDSDISQLKTDTGSLITRTTSLETRADGVDDALLDKVDVTTFNSLEDTVDGHTQTISQHTTAISNKADGSTVTALTNRVSKNEQDISGINTSVSELQSTVATKADGSTVETISSNLSSLQQDVNGFKTTVASTYATKASVDASDPFIVGTQTAATGDWTGDAPMLESLVEGQTITYYLPFAGSGAASLNLTLKNGTTTGEVPIYRYANTTLTTQIGANSAIPLVYTDGRWYVRGTVNTDTYDRVRSSNAIKADTAISSSRVIVGTNDGYKHALPGVSFDISYPILWSTGAIAADKTATTAYLAYPSCTLRNNKSGISLTAYNTVYLVGTLNGRTFTIDDAVFSLAPTSQNGKYYIPLGVLYSAYQMYFRSDKTLYYYGPNGFGPVSEGALATANTAQSNLDTYKTTVSTTYATKTELTQTESGISASVAETYATKTSLSDAISTEVTNRNTAINAKAGEITASVSETYATKTELADGIDDANDYTDSEITSAKAAIKVTTDGISTEVAKKTDKDSIISTINQSAESITINASKVNIAGATIFTSGRLSQESLDSSYDASGSAATAKSEAIAAIPTDISAFNNDRGFQTATQVNSTITSKGYATTTQAQGYASTAKSEAISAAATDATSKANAAEANAKAAIPSDISELNNDSGYITSADVPTKVSDLTNDANYATTTQAQGYASTAESNAIAAIPTDISAFNNDSGFQTATQVNSTITSKGYATTTQAQGYASTAESNAIAAIPTDISAFNNDSGYGTTTQIATAKSEAISAANDATDEKLEDYSTTAESDAAYDSKGSASSALNSAKSYVDGKGYQTASDVSSAITSGIAGKADKSDTVKRTQRIWYRSNSSTAPATPGTASSNWVTKSDDGNAAWTKMHVAITNTYKYIYTCEQYEMASGTVGYTSVLRDNTITVIDGGTIITGTVNANAVNASSGTFDTANIPNLNADKITSGDISAARISANVISAINSLSAGQIDAARVNASQLTIGPSQVTGLQTALDSKADSSDIPTKVSDLTNDSNFATQIQAQGYASTAESNAVSTAAADATTKANAAQSNAISTAAADATTKANDAKKYATNYISADSTGIRIANANPSTATTYQHQTATETEFFVSGTSVGQFGGSGARIGKTAESHIEMDYHSLRLIDTDGNSYFHVSDMRDRSKRYRTYDTVEYIATGAPSYTTKQEGFTSLQVYKETFTNTYGDSIDIISQGWPEWTISDSTATRSESFYQSYQSRSIDTTKPVTVVYAVDYEMSGTVALTFGSRSGTVGVKSFAAGEDVEASGYSSYAEGYGTTASGNYSHAEGQWSTASGGIAHSEGLSTTAAGSMSHAEGHLTEAHGLVSHVEGYQSIATSAASYSHAEGMHCTTNALHAHAEGYNTTASGPNAHSEGYETTASGLNGHAEGLWSRASGAQAHAQNEATIAAYDNQTAIGKYNDNQSTNAFEIGNGTTIYDRSNAFAVDWDGNVNAAGDLEGERVISHGKMFAYNQIETGPIIDLHNIDHADSKDYMARINQSGGYLLFEATDGGYSSSAMPSRAGMTLMPSGNLRRRHYDPDTSAWDSWHYIEYEPVSAALSLGSNCLAYNTAQTPRVIRWGCVCHLVGAVKPSTEVAAGGSLTIGTIPAAYRPLESVNVLCQGSNQDIWLLGVSPSGNVTASRYRNGSGTQAAMTTSRWLTFSTTWLMLSAS